MDDLTLSSGDNDLILSCSSFLQVSFSDSETGEPFGSATAGDFDRDLDFSLCKGGGGGDRDFSRLRVGGDRDWELEHEFFSSGEGDLDFSLGGDDAVRGFSFAGGGDFCGDAVGFSFGGGDGDFSFGGGDGDLSFGGGDGDFSLGAGDGDFSLGGGGGDSFLGGGDGDFSLAGGEGDFSFGGGDGDLSFGADEDILLLDDRRGLLASSWWEDAFCGVSFRGSGEGGCSLAVRLFASCSRVIRPGVDFFSGSSSV